MDFELSHRILEWIRTLLLEHGYVLVEDNLEEFFETSKQLYFNRLNETNFSIVQKLIQLGRARSAKPGEVERLLSTKSLKDQVVKQEAKSEDKIEEQESKEWKEILKRLKEIAKEETTPKKEPKMAAREMDFTESMSYKEWYKSAFNATECRLKADGIKELIKSPITLEHLSAMNAMMLTIRDLEESWERMIEDTKYIGFDAVHLGGVLWMCSHLAGDGEDGAANPFYNDMVFLILLFLQRGTSVIDKKKIGTMKKETTKTVAHLKKKYNILSNLKNADKSNAITLSRIAAVFPLITCHIMYYAKVDRPVAHQSMEKLYNSYPAHLRCSSFFSLFYPGGKQTGLVKALLHYQFLEGEVINSNNKDYKEKSKAEKMEDVIKYSNATYRTKVLSEEERKAANAKFFGKISATTMKVWGETFDRVFSEIDLENIEVFFEQNLG